MPSLNIVARGAVVPWTEPRQVEQDLIICYAIIELYTDPFLGREIRLRGGAALHKEHFPEPLPYSEDIDLVRTTVGPIGPILDHARAALEPWLGRAGFDRSPVAPKLRFRASSEHHAAAPFRLKLEINTSEIEACDAPRTVSFGVDNPWFSGVAEVATLPREEILTIKSRALPQRDQGRDLFDLAHALNDSKTLMSPRGIQ